MSNAEKIINKWNQNTPAEASINDILVVLDYYFKDQWRHAKTGSHIIVQDDILKQLYGRIPIEVNSLGEFTVCTVKGRKVKNVYLKKVCKVIEIIDRWRKKENEKNT